MIELESGQDGSTLGAVPARGSRSYNYRVVMRKGKRRGRKRERERERERKRKKKENRERRKSKRRERAYFTSPQH
jgi:hypothetical protein